ncbi:MAG: arginine repressor [Clostridiales bacterium]|nr:arginine repressor [Clostridiales bacterium]
MTRSTRQTKILELIADRVVETQDDLARLLQEAGFNATQATISRDIKELGIVKMSIDGKRQKYVREAGNRSVPGKFVNLFRHAVVSIRYANNIVVIKTLPGSANIAGMMLDRLENPDILGCVAGDDTVMAVTVSEKAAQQITDTLSGLSEQ